MAQSISARLERPARRCLRMGAAAAFPFLVWFATSRAWSSPASEDAPLGRDGPVQARASSQPGAHERAGTTPTKGQIAHFRVKVWPSVGQEYTSTLCSAGFGSTTRR